MMTQDQRADRTAWLWIVVLSALNCVVNVTSQQMEMARSQGGIADFPVRSALAWLYEGSSLVAILVASSIVPVLITRFSLSHDNWGRRIPIYVVGFVIFTVIHVVLMVALRELIYPMIASGAYHFGLIEVEPWVYEIRKDAVSFIVIVATFLVCRQLRQQRVEADAAHDEAQDTGRITLKAGGRTIYLNASDIVFAKAAANYVEVHTRHQMHFVRMTLAALANQLDAAGHHVRCHRSYIVGRAEIGEWQATGNRFIRLGNGSEITIPVGKSYVDDVAQAVSAEVSR